VGHWDLVDYGGDTGHLCPASELRKHGVQNIYSGHWHLAGDYDVDGVNVKCTGSMQPMTHAEDPEGKMYVTLTYDEYIREDIDLTDKYVRVIVGAGEDVSPPETCLGFKVQVKEQEPEEQERVNLGDFDIKKILDQKLTEYNVPDPIQKEIKANLHGIT
jgi:hypothetical protein